MDIVTVNPKIKYIYHYTSKKNIDKILKDKAIISKDQYVFFTKSLKDSILAFEREMMVENKLYIDVNGTLKRREKCNKDDYCILKIPYINDNEFYKFKFDNQSENSIYSISISHKGAYNFEKAQIIEFPKNKTNNILTKTAIAAITTGIILFPPYHTFAASWLDTNNYDTAWYVDSTATEYSIKNAKEMAGLAYLVNNENITFEGKDINVISDIDLTENSWQTIKEIFKGNICGGHRFILNCLDGKLVAQQEIDKVEYSYNVKIDSNITKKVNVKKPYTVAKLKEATNNASTVFFNNTKLSDDVLLSSLNLNKNDIIEVFSGKYITVQDSEGLQIPFRFESGEAILNAKRAYSEKTNIPQERLVFKYNGIELNDYRTLADYGIQLDDTIYVYEKININAIVEKGEGTVETSKSTALSGEEILITLTPADNYEIEEILINGESVKNKVEDAKIKIKCKNKDINVKVSYKLKSNTTEGAEVKPKFVQENKSELNTETSPKEEIKDNDENPKTGDNIFAYVAMCVSSFVGIIILNIKKKYNKE